MSYLVLARKWRPQTFAEVVAQPHVVRALQNAIRLERLPHALLLTGSRGVGKTTIARLIAKTINCKNQNPDNIEPCNDCFMCNEITDGRAVDVMEIDGASNRSIDDIRDLRDNVQYLPNKGSRKVYIIDEVHMLTREAFNALLKTLEEPPDHVIFLFATTEPHKIPITILSRCQRFDFKRADLPILRGHLERIAKLEGLEISKVALTMVARGAAGGMRDSMSLLDQVIAFAGLTPTDEQVAEAIGVIHRSLLQKMVGALFTNEPGVSLKCVKEIFAFGYDMRQFTQELATFLRDLMIVKVCKNPMEVTEIAEDELVTMSELIKDVPADLIQQHFQVLTEAAEGIAQASHPRLLLEMTLIRMSRLQPMRPFDQILQQLSSLENRLQEDIATGGASGPPASGGNQAPPPKGMQTPQGNPGRQQQRGPRNGPPQNANAPQQRPPQHGGPPQNRHGGSQAPPWEQGYTPVSPDEPPPPQRRHREPPGHFSGGMQGPPPNQPPHMQQRGGPPEPPKQRREPQRREPPPSNFPQAPPPEPPPWEQGYSPVPPDEPPPRRLGLANNGGAPARAEEPKISLKKPEPAKEGGRDMAQRMGKLPQKARPRRGQKEIDDDPVAGFGARFAAHAEKKAREPQAPTQEPNGNGPGSLGLLSGSGGPNINEEATGGLPGYKETGLAHIDSVKTGPHAELFQGWEDLLMKFSRSESGGVFAQGLLEKAHCEPEDSGVLYLSYKGTDKWHCDRLAGKEKDFEVFLKEEGFSYQVELRILSFQDKPTRENLMEARMRREHEFRLKLRKEVEDTPLIQEIMNQFPNTKWVSVEPVDAKK